MLSPRIWRWQKLLISILNCQPIVEVKFCSLVLATIGLRVFNMPRYKLAHISNMVIYRVFRQRNRLRCLQLRFLLPFNLHGIILILFFFLLPVWIILNDGGPKLLIPLYLHPLFSISSNRHLWLLFLNFVNVDHCHLQNLVLFLLDCIFFIDELLHLPSSHELLGLGFIGATFWQPW